MVDLLRGVETPETGDGAMTCTTGGPEEAEAEETLIFLLPDELLGLIISELSAADLARVAKVCKQLRNLIMCEPVLGVRGEGDGQGILAGGALVSRTEGTREDREQALLSICSEGTCPVGALWMLRSGVDVIERFGLAPERVDADSRVEIFVNTFCDGAGRSPLHVAAQEGNVRIAALLLAYSVAINAGEVRVDAGGAASTTPMPEGVRWRNQTPLMLAVRGGHLDVVRLLLNKGAHVNLIDVDGNTALYWAVFLGNAAIVELLIEHGADINLVNGLGQQLAAVAEGRGHFGILEILDRTRRQDALERIDVPSQEDDDEIDIAMDDGGAPGLGEGWRSDDEGSREGFGARFFR